MTIGSNKYSFCKMFVRSSDPANVLPALVEILDGRVHQRRIEHSGAIVEVLRNPDASPDRAHDFCTGRSWSKSSWTEPWRWST